jgi:hypothetical protein
MLTEMIVPEVASFAVSPKADLVAFSSRGTQDLTIDDREKGQRHIGRGSPLLFSPDGTTVLCGNVSKAPLFAEPPYTLVNIYTGAVTTLASTLDAIYLAAWEPDDLLWTSSGPQVACAGAS